MNTADKAYNELLEDILKNGKVHDNRTGTDTLSVFGRQLRFNLQDGFPLLTGKRVWFKGVLHELLWFLGAVPEKYKSFSQTNIKYLVDNDVNIWNEWPYQYYVKQFNKLKKDGSIPEIDAEPLSQEEFIKEIKTDDKFARVWGDLGPVYGEQWTNWEVPPSKYQEVDEPVFINQIQQMIDRLKTNPDCRRIIVSAWNPSDLPEYDIRTDDELYENYLKSLESR